MLVLQVVCNVLLSVLFQRLSPIKEASSFTTFHWNFGISATIHNLDSILVGLCAIHHESFKLGIEDSMSSHDLIEIFPKNHLSIFVFRLKVVHYKKKGPSTTH